MEDSKDIAYYRILAAIETDATRYHGDDASRPGLLEATQAEQMLAHLATDLQNLFPDIGNCSLIAPGALYDQTQILRPGYPVFSALEATSRAGSASNFRPGLVSLGAEDSLMPVTDLQPLPDIPPGLLQCLPLVVHGPRERVEALGQAMEYRFLEEGQLSANSASWMQTAFGISVNHARFMTLMDLSAMLQLQLEHFGFLPMWQLLDTALSAGTQALTVRTDQGIELQWRDGAVHAAFETFDYWASRGAGRACDAARQGLAQGYGDWTREIRQYLTTLAAHAVELRLYLPGQPGTTLEGSFMEEVSQFPPTGDGASVTQHSYGEVGSIAVSLVRDGEQRNYYPLKASGLNDIHAHVRSRMPGGTTMAFPGTILYDERSRSLISDPGREDA